MNTIDFFYATCRLATQTVAPNIPGFQGINQCVKYRARRSHKPTFYLSNYYDESNSIRIIFSGNQVKDYITQNCLEYHQNADSASIINIRWSVSGIIHTLIGVAV